MPSTVSMVQTLGPKKARFQRMSEMEAVLFMLNLVTCHKTTDELGKSVWNILRTALGEEGLSTFHTVKHLLKNFQRYHVVKVDICCHSLTIPSVVNPLLILLLSLPYLLARWLGLDPSPIKLATFLFYRTFA